MPELSGVVTGLITNPRKNNEVFGLNIDGKEMVYSFPEYRGEPFEDNLVQVGLTVRVEYAEREKEGKTKLYISVLEVLEGEGGAEPTVFQDSDFRAEGDSIPVPPPNPPDQAWGFEQKDKSILMQTCLKASAQMWVESLRAAVELYKLAEKKPSADELNAYAQAIMERKLPPTAEVLKKWAMGALD